MGEQKRGINWLPLARITLFLVLAVLTGLFGALMGVAIVWAWLSLEHGAPVELSSVSPESRFAISACYHQRFISAFGAPDFRFHA
jgi:hypothetical protein